MKSLYFQDSIVALATPAGMGGLGVLRLSGPDAPRVFSGLWKGKKTPDQFESHRLYRGDLLHPQSAEVLDSVLAVWMRAPHSFTGEDVIEIYAHGSPLILSLLLDVLRSEGLRLAEPGEFTRRAFLNGKLDLLQAEAVGEMIHANSEAALRNARLQLQGRISARVEALRQRLLLLLAEIEAAIDFPEEDIEIITRARVAEKLSELQKELQVWLEKFGLGRLIREGVSVALVGRPNVGKSSLLNRLLEEERVIVHEKAGTTRDVIEAWLHLDGVAFQLFDTAGIRESCEEVEQEGMRRSQAVAGRADLTLWVFDVSEPLTAEDRQIGTWLAGNVIAVGNKLDRVCKAGCNLIPVWRQFLAEHANIQDRVEVSARSGEGVEALKKLLVKAAGVEGLTQKSEAFLNNARHRDAVQRALEALSRAWDGLEAGIAVECVAAEVKAALHFLECLIGKTQSEDVLEVIFSRFCIGK